MTTITPAALASMLEDAQALPFQRLDLPLVTMIALAKEVAPQQDAFGILRLAACDSVTEGIRVLEASLAALTPKKRTNFEAGCLALTPERWQALGYDSSVVFGCLMPHRVPDLKKLKAWQALTKQPLDLASHWANVVADAIERQDWPAAWDAVRVAHLGHPKSATVPLQQLQNWTPWVTLDRLREERMFYVPIPASRKLIMDLFDAMSAASLVQSGLEEMRKTDSVLKVQAGARTTKVPRPGLLEMTGFFTRMTPGKEWPLKLDAVGSMVLGLAEWASRQKKKKATETFESGAAQELAIA